MRMAVIEQDNKTVRNVVEFDGGAEWFAPEGFFTVPSDVLNIGDVYEE